MVRRIIFLNGIAGRRHHCQIRNHPRTMFLHGLKLHQKKYGRSSRSVEAMRAGVSGPTDCDPRQRVLTTRKNLTEEGKRSPPARILSYGFAAERLLGGNSSYPCALLAYRAARSAWASRS